MKTILIPLILLFSCAAFVPNITPTEGQVKALVQIKECPGLSKQQIYSRALSWIARSYNSANDVIQLKDPDAGQIVCKGLGSARFDVGFTRSFRYTLIVDVKEEKLRVRFENILSERVGEVAGPDMKYQWDEVAAYLANIGNTLAAEVSKAEAEDNW